jgi:hypothetical protein
LLVELKTRARLALNAARRGDPPASVQAQAAGGAALAGSSEPRLRHCLNHVAQEAGFINWEHARRVLSGRAAAGDDFGTFWHASRCDVLLNQWFAHYDQARAYLAQAAESVLLPYRRQFVVADASYLNEIGVPLCDPNWQQAGGDLIASSGSEAWIALCLSRLQSTRAKVS